MKRTVLGIGLIVGFAAWLAWTVAEDGSAVDAIGFALFRTLVVALVTAPVWDYLLWRRARR